MGKALLCRAFFFKHPRGTGYEGGLRVSMYQTHILKNGLKIIHQQVDGKAAWCGLIIGVGSRDERPEEEGIAHFIEHVIFKGTEKRKAFHILSRIEDVGGELNAYTTKEDTCIYASFLARDYERALELFADIVFHSVFPEKEIEKEKEVVIDEINSYKDSPGELIFDDFEELIYPDYPIGRNILGSEKAVKGLRRDDIIDFVKRNYRPGRMVISSVGDIPFDKLVRLIERYFGDIPGDPAVLVRERPGIYLPRQKVIDMDTYQNHCIIGNVAYDYTEDKRLAFSLLVNILGGTGMNSRLNLNIREKYGLAYNIEASYTPYSDTGIFTIYFGCDAGDLDKCLRLCRKEMAALGEELLGYNQLRKAKNQMIGQITLASENYENMMLSSGKSFLIYDNGKQAAFQLLFRSFSRLFRPVLPGLCQGDAHHLRRSGGEEGPGTFGQGGAGGDHVVGQQDPEAGGIRRSVHPQHVGPALARLLQTGLGRGIPGLAQQGEGGDLQHPGGLLRQQAGLVIAPLPQAPGAERGPGHAVEPSVQLVPDALGHELAEGAGIAPAAGEFVAVDGLPHRAPVGQGRDAHPEKFPRAPGGVPLQPRQRPLTIRAEQGVPLRQEPAAEGTAGREQEVEERAAHLHGTSALSGPACRGGTAAGDHALMIIRIGKRRK